jgi:vancomycin resistance protein YoaR
MASLQSSLNHGLPGCFGFVEVFGMVSSAIDITVSKDGRDTLTSEQDISNKLGQTFSKDSSTQNYHPEFQKLKMQKEKTKLNLNQRIWRNTIVRFNLIHRCTAI